MWLWIVLVYWGSWLSSPTQVPGNLSTFRGMGVKQRFLYHGEKSPNYWLRPKLHGNQWWILYYFPFLLQDPRRLLEVWTLHNPSAGRRLLIWYSEYDLTMSYDTINHHFDCKWWTLGTVMSDNAHGVRSPTQKLVGFWGATFVTAKSR